MFAMFGGPGFFFEKLLSTSNVDFCFIEHQLANFDIFNTKYLNFPAKIIGLKSYFKSEF